jgi:adenylosuccinate synthase
MIEAKIVVGANYGDEGKGLMTDFFTREKKSIVVLHNGGAQRGHTVYTLDTKKKHIFHHFGSGYINNAPTYFSEDFILNPMMFVREYDELNEKFPDKRCKVYGHFESLVTFPHDILYQQYLENKRGKDRHGSCGIGIRTTQLRNENVPTTVNTLVAIQKEKKSINKFAELWYDINNYYIKLFKKTNSTIEEYSQYENIIYNENVIKHFYEDIRFTFNKINFIDDPNNLFKNFERIVFEGGQGLLLDQNYKVNFPHLTPSNTGTKNPFKILKNIETNVEICYVTRAYITRHGNGTITYPCSKEKINASIIDETNEPNEWQGILRYGYINPIEMYNVIYDDLSNWKNYDKIISLAITHLNETNNVIYCGNEQYFVKEFIEHCLGNLVNKIYCSYDKFGQMLAITKIGFNDGN